MMPSNPFGLINPFFRGAAEAAFGVLFFGGFCTEEQIDIVKEAVSRFRESEIDQSSLPQHEKDIFKQQWRQWLESYAHGFKESLKQQGRLK